ncbi:MAG: aldo/keto reductase [Verrucomicrobia bacterium]|nr:aldo/keto reductase [Verrucomicrobiota bacterium]
MKTITLGKSTLHPSRLAYGCWRLGGSWEPSEISPEREAVARKAILTAFEQGFTFFDHADIYCHGHSETLFGKVLHEVSGMRDQVTLATKCGIRRKGEPNPDSPYRYDYSSEHIIQACEGSLRRLGVDTLDLFQLHRYDLLTHPEEVARAFQTLRHQGKARWFGVSNFTASQFRTLQSFLNEPLISNQVEISLIRLDHLLDGTLDLCLSEKVSPLAWSPLAAGRLASHSAIDLNSPDHAHRAQLRERLDVVAHARHTSRSVIAIAWLLAHPAGIIPIIGATTPDHIVDAAKAESLELTREEWYGLYEAGLGHRLP